MGFRQISGFEGPDRTPDLRPDRCVHSRIEGASCRACLDACPRDAWVMNEEYLGIDGARCDGCDLCAAACPETAIPTRFHPKRYEWDGVPLALACCEYAPISDPQAPRMPCVQALGILELLRLAHLGVRELLLASGDCERCHRGTKASLFARLAPVNRLLRGRGRPEIRCRTQAAPRWERIWRQLDAQANRRSLSRRHFFRAMRTEPKRHMARLREARETWTPGAFLPEGTPGDPVPFAPRIDPQACTGCDACARLCPHRAITIETRDRHVLAYGLQGDACSGCGICVDLCESDAVRLVFWQPWHQTRVPLKEDRCQACGVIYHLPADRREDASGRCPICRRTDHHRTLFQVLDPSC